MKLDREQFVARVAELAGLSEEQAEEGTKIVFSALSHRISEGEAEDVGEELSPSLDRLWDTDAWVDSFALDSGRFSRLRYRSREELYALVGRNARERGLSVSPEILVGAVFEALKAQLSERERRDISSQLPETVASLWAAV